MTTNLPSMSVGSERLTGALLDRLTHHVHILEMNGESYRLKRSRENAAPSYSCNVATLTDLLRQSSGRWYTVTLPQWPNFSAPLTVTGCPGSSGP